MSKKNTGSTNWQAPRQATTGKRIIDAFLECGPMTIMQAVQVTGIHHERIRHVVRPPQFEVAGEAGEGKRKAIVWRIV